MPWLPRWIFTTSSKKSSKTKLLINGVTKWRRQPSWRRIPRRSPTKSGMIWCCQSVTCWVCSPRRLWHFWTASIARTPTPSISCCSWSRRSRIRISSYVNTWEIDCRCKLNSLASRCRPRALTSRWDNFSSSSNNKATLQHWVCRSDSKIARTFINKKLKRIKIWSRTSTWRSAFIC